MDALTTAEIMTPEQELGAARLDAEATARLVAERARLVAIAAGLPPATPIGVSLPRAEDKAAAGSTLARRIITNYLEAATAYEGARTTLATLAG